MRIIRVKKLRFKIYPIIWSGIILVAVYLLLRFAALSFTNDFGQAGLKDALISKAFYEAMASGHSLISYTADTKEDSYTFPVSWMEKELVLFQFTGENSLTTATAQGYSFLSNEMEYNQTEEALSSDITEDTEEISTSIGFHDITGGLLTREYILTNGAVINHLFVDMNGNQLLGSLQIGYLAGDLETEEADNNHDSADAAVVNTIAPIEYTLEQLSDINFLIKHFYIVDATTKVTDELFDAKALLSKDMTIKQEKDAPQILIYHTHSSEAYVDSRPGEISDTVVGVGDYLTEILENDYGYNVIHDTTSYNYVDGKKVYDAYINSLRGLTAILEENPSIEVIIDLHRDSPAARNVYIDGKETAQIMLFNGLCRDQSGPKTNLENPYLQDNLAFSLQLQLKSNTMYPGLFFRNYLKGYRYNLHLRPKSILVELGTDDNTLQSAMNAMKPFAEVLDAVLKGE